MSTMLRTRVVTGKAPVDEECTDMLGKAQVFSEGEVIWDCILNQTNIDKNENKFYIIQLLKENAKQSYHVWQRWGRVGYRGCHKLDPFEADLDQAKKKFEEKFQDKTKNDWYSRASFTKYPGKYDLLEIDYGAQMEDTVREITYDSRQAPLGKLTDDQIQKGNAALTEIGTIINNGNPGRALMEACNDFYTRIPHDFRMETPPLILNQDTVEREMQLLEELRNIVIRRV